MADAEPATSASSTAALISEAGAPLLGDASEIVSTKGAEAFRRLSWERLAIMLIVEAVALGSLSMPSVFATLGLIPALLVTIGIGCVAIYTSYLIGQVKLRYPQTMDFADAGYLLAGRAGYRFVSVMLVGLLVLGVGAHVLTGTLAFRALLPHAICDVSWSLLAALILFVLALPISFHDMSWLGFVDFASILAAIGVVMVGSAIDARQQPGGLGAVEWYYLLPPDKQPSFAKATLATTQVVLAFAYAQCQFSFQSELKIQADYMKSIWTLGAAEILIYTLTGSLLYIFIGQDVQAPALLSTSPAIQRAAFAVALPVIFISGSINGQTAARFLFRLRYKGTPHEFFATRHAQMTWVLLSLALTAVAWLVAELIPFFSPLLGLAASLFVSFFTFILPAMFQLRLLAKSEARTRRSIATASVSVLVLVLGVSVLVLGVYASGVDIKNSLVNGVGRPFSCGRTALSDPPPRTSLVFQRHITPA